MQPRHCLQPEQDEGQAVEVEAGWLKSVCHDGKKEQKNPPHQISKSTMEKTRSNTNTIQSNLQTTFLKFPPGESTKLQIVHTRLQSCHDRFAS